jgi:parallel beta-helix repeat protein
MIMFRKQSKKLERFVLIILSLGVLLCEPRDGAAATHDVVDQQSFDSALAKAVGGDSINLSGPNRFDLKVNSRNFLPSITITSQQGRSSPEVNSIDVKNSSGIVFDHLRLSPAPDGKQPRFLVVVFDSTGIEIANFKAVGSAREFLTQSNKSYAAGKNFARIRTSRNIRVRNNQISNFNFGIGVAESSDVEIADNDISQLQGDGLQMVGVRNIAVVGNRMHDFISSETSVNHNDFIQLWSTNAEAVSSDILIARNRLLERDGPNIQGIFMRNEQVDLSKGVLKDRFYRNIVIEDNLIHNHHWHGITVGESDNLVVKNNTILPTISPMKARKDYDKQMVPRIKVAKQSSHVTIVANVTSGIDAPEDAHQSKNYILAIDFTVRKQLMENFGRTEMLGVLPDSAYITKRGEILATEKIGSVLTREP